MFVGYSKETRGRIFYSPKENKTFVSTNATFLEHDYVNNHKPRSKVVLEEMVSNEVAKSPATTNEKRQEETASSSQNSREPRRSGRVSKQPTRYKHEVQILVSDTNKDDQLTFKGVMNDSDKDKWQDAMNQEMESMYSNSV